MIAWTLFYNPMILSFNRLLWLLIPLCASVAIVYKTVRIRRLDNLHIQIISLLLYMLVGLVLLGTGLWLLHEYWPF